MLELAKQYLKPEVVELLKNVKGEIKMPNLLSGNTKLDKGKSIVVGLALLPATSLEAYTLDTVKTENMCPTAKAHFCDKICIGLYSGHYSMLRGSAHKAQIKRSLAFQFDFEGFKAQLFGELAVMAGKAIAGDTKAYIRLDVFSDNKIKNAELIREFALKFPDLIDYLEWYDYTKIHTIQKTDSMWNVYGRYGSNIALSVSKESTKGKLFNQYLKALPSFNYSAIVVHETEVAETIKLLNTVSSNVQAVNGDLFDNFTTHKNDPELIDHTILVLKSKGSKNTTKQAVTDTFSVTEREAFILYVAAFSSLIK